ncbi:MAG: hypothetical protein ABI999_01105 [Acidobacteriota bacterium]
MSDGWQIAIERPRGKRRETPMIPYASINKRGEIAMNAEAFRRIGSPASVSLFFDRAQNAIGVKFPISADRNFFPVRAYGRGRRMRIIRAARLLKQFEIEINQTLAFRPTPIATYDGHPMLVLHLDAGKPITV